MTTTTKTDYYRLLGVRPDATVLLIKKAYRKLAKQYHPDLNHASDTAERFREITEAYDTLTDPDRRRRYDRLHGYGQTGPGDGERSRYHRTRDDTGPGTGSSSRSTTSPTTGRILTVLESIWMEIRRWHPDIPSAVIIIASGTDGKNPRYGHHAPGRWNAAGQQYAEIMISGEGLRRAPADVLGTLLHEAAHALAHAHGIKDTSRQGRYHNKHFKAYAEQLGLTLTHDERNGWSASTLTPATRLIYAPQLATLTDVMTLWRHGDTTTSGPTARRSSNFIAAICPCGRSIRIAASTLAEAPITCQACDGDFQAKNAPGA